MSTPKSYVVSFRTTHKIIELANAELLKFPVPSCKDHKQFSRKLLMDYVNGKLEYIDPLDRQENPALPKSSGH